MPIFKKRGGTIDLTELQKRGILQKSEVLAKAQPKTTNDFVELPSHSPSVSPASSSPFSFLDSLANASSPSTPSPEILPQNTNTSHIQIKLEELEYKLDRLIERITQLESKLNAG